MSFDVIWEVLPSSVLAQAAHYLGFSPFVRNRQGTLEFLSDLPAAAQEKWVDANRHQIRDEFCRLGSWSFATNRSYTEVLQGVARKFNANNSTSFDNALLETSIIVKVWNDAFAKMTPEQRAAAQAQIEQISAQHGKSLGKEFTGLAALSVAQMSGFGVYLLGSTLLGAANGALGLGLGFGAFTGLSSLISTAIGPVGWTALGLVTIVKLGAPNYKKVLPVVWLIAANRAVMADAIPSKEEELRQKLAMSIAPGGLASLKLPEVTG